MNQSEMDWIDELLSKSQMWVSSMIGPTSSIASPLQLDEALEAWASKPDSEKSNINEVINMVGAALGTHLCQRCELRWVVASDEEGTEAAVFRETNEVLLYPMNAIAKRIVEGSTRFVEQFIETTETHLSGLPSASEQLRFWRRRREK
jgi:hypothetical protein